MVVDIRCHARTILSKYPEQFLRFPPDSDFLVIRPRDCIRIVKTLSWSTQTWRVVLTIDNWGELVVEVIVNKVVDEEVDEEVDEKVDGEVDEEVDEEDGDDKSVALTIGAGK